MGFDGRRHNAEKARVATRRPFAIQVSNWVAGADGGPPTCSIHAEIAVWHKNRARESGGQWVCKTCQRLKSKGQRRLWKRGHTDPLTYNLKRSFGQAKHNSKKIGRDFTIAFADVMAMWGNQGGKCAITDTPMEFIPGDGERRRNKVTMDRIDSSLGYVDGNVWLVAEWANRAKTDLTREELITFAHGLIKNLPR